MTVVDRPAACDRPRGRRAPADVSPLRLRRVMSAVPTSVALVAGLTPGGEPVGMVIGTFTSVSLEPPLVSFMVSRSSRSWSRLRACTRVCVNVLAASQRSVCAAFVGPEPTYFARVPWHLSDHGSPELDESPVVVDCEVVQLVEAGDHEIVLCRVLDMRAQARPAQPLVFWNGEFGSVLAESSCPGEGPAASTPRDVGRTEQAVALSVWPPGWTVRE